METNWSSDRHPENNIPAFLKVGIITTRAPHNGCQGSAVGAGQNDLDLVTQKWEWCVEIMKVQLNMKSESCRRNHFDFRGNVHKCDKC
jgi:hypothetical protein